uniref:Uncharacterized protein n=1 Tax=Rhizophora mucronata TaxID=61149 RepID=A0A2P2P9E6_RHIMU
MSFICSMRFTLCLIVEE